MVLYIISVNCSVTFRAPSSPSSYVEGQYTGAKQFLF